MRSIIRSCLLATLPLLLALPACGGDGDNWIRGSAEKNYDLAFDTVEIGYQEKGGALDAMIVEYVREPDNKDKRQVPVKIVANKPKAGVKHDLMGGGGSIFRVMRDASSFPEIVSGNITFDDLGKPGDSASGEFFVTFDNGQTLNGGFAGTVRAVTFGQ